MTQLITLIDKKIVSKTFRSSSAGNTILLAIKVSSYNYQTFSFFSGQVECLNCMLSRCRGIEIDARNNLGFTPLMKAALQGRNKCAKLLLFAGKFNEELI